MSREKYIVLDSNMSEFKALKNKIASNPMKKISLLDASFNQIHDETIKLLDDGFRYYNARYSINYGKNGNIFLRVIAKSGFIFQKGKITFWFGTSISKLNKSSLISILNANECDWFTKLFSPTGIFRNVDIKSLLTKTLLEKILTKKITNLKQLISEFGKLSFGVKFNNNKLIINCIRYYYGSLMLLKGFILSGVDYSIFSKSSEIINACAVKLYRGDVEYDMLRLILKYYTLTKRTPNINKWSRNRFINEYTHISSLINKAKKCELVDVYNLEFSHDTRYGKIELVSNKKDLTKIMTHLNVKSHTINHHLNDFDNKNFIYLHLCNNSNIDALIKCNLSIIRNKCNSDKVLRCSYQLNMNFITNISNVSIRNIIEDLHGEEQKLMPLFNRNNLFNNTSNVLDDKYDNEFNYEFPF